jgi:hypothetical protein
MPRRRLGISLILDAVASDNCCPVSPEADVPKWMALAGSKGCGALSRNVYLYGALEVLLRRGTIKKNDSVLVFNTVQPGIPKQLREELPRIDLSKPIVVRHLKLGLRGPARIGDQC